MTTLVTFKLDPPDVQKPVSDPLRPLSYAKREAAAKIVREGVKYRVMAHCVFMSKPNGEYRLCADYRFLAV